MAEELRKVFPDSESDISNVSANISLDNSSAILFVTGLKEGDCASLEFYIGDDCEGEWFPFRDCCGQAVINGGPCCSNFMVLPLPLKYRVVLSDEDENYLNDVNWFDNVSIWYKKIPLQTDLTEFYYSCCDNSAKEDILSDINLNLNKIMLKM